MNYNRPPVTTVTTLHCPACGSAYEVTMPTDACQVVYQCPQCATVLRPKAGDCCVFCSYGDHPCPPLQAARCAD
ncbi:MAG TPA: GDCCVxC domain-containing (seleno)protein [Roseiflexaceae bacterium]|nr:GDCCVxC domain-containing (seleno)protein [Roseiflexaceae bacterium]